MKRNILELGSDQNDTPQKTDKPRESVRPIDPLSIGSHNTDSQPKSRRKRVKKWVQDRRAKLRDLLNRW